LQVVDLIFGAALAVELDFLGRRKKLGEARAVDSLLHD